MADVPPPPTDMSPTPGTDTNGLTIDLLRAGTGWLLLMAALDALVLGIAPMLLALRLAGLAVPLGWWLGRRSAPWLGPVWLAILILGQLMAAYLWSRVGAPPAMMALCMGGGLLLIPILGPSCWMKVRRLWRLPAAATADRPGSTPAPAILQTLATTLDQRLDMVAGHLRQLDGDRHQIDAAQRELAAARAQLHGWLMADGPTPRPVAAPARPPAAGPAPALPALGPVTRPFSILLVDEDRVGRSVMRMLLERDGHRVEETDDAKMGLEMALVEGPELVLAALRLDRHRGLALARCIAAGKGPPVYLLRGPADRVTMQQAERAGVQGVIDKPVTLATLRTLLAGLGDRVPPPLPPEPVLDPTVLAEHLELLGASRVVQIIDSFLDTAPETLAVIAEALAAGDVAAVGRAAHKLASGALTVGATALAELAKQIDTAAKRDNRDGAFSGAARLPAHYAAAAGALADFRERHRPAGQG